MGSSFTSIPLGLMCKRIASMFALAVVGVSLWGCGGSNSGGSATGDQGQRQRGNQPAEPEVSVDDFLIPIDTPGEWVTTEANYESPDAVWQEVMQFEKDNDMAGKKAGPR